jgi:hypothetical protein
MPPADQEPALKERECKRSAKRGPAGTAWKGRKDGMLLAGIIQATRMLADFWPNRKLGYLRLFPLPLPVPLPEPESGKGKGMGTGTGVAEKWDPGVDTRRAWALCKVDLADRDSDVTCLHSLGLPSYSNPGLTYSLRRWRSAS